MEPRIVLDTNVLVAAFRSKRGASYKILSLVGTGAFTMCLSVPLMLEYEQALTDQLAELPLKARDVGALLDFIGSVAEPCTVYYRWRPYLPDAKDDMVIELAVAAGSRWIVTHNIRHFRNLPHFEVEALTPAQFLHEIGEAS